MFEYIYRDLMSVARYLPCSMVMGMLVSGVLLWAAGRVRRRKGGTALRVLPVTVFVICLSVMLFITFLSRESGSGEGMDLKLFSTWGINERNNAFVVENVLLFIPYGLCGPWAFGKMRRFAVCALSGAAVSLFIEFLQLMTRRGYFQVDDILTNTLGTLIGWCIFRMLWRKKD